MQDPRQIRIADYTYSLPPERIAHFPLTQRDSSKLLIYQSGNISEDRYHNLADHLPKDTLLVFNNTRVVEARLLFQKPSGGVIEIFCLEPGPGYPDISAALQTTGSVTWKCLVGGASKWKHGQVLEKVWGDTRLEARFHEKQSDAFLVELTWKPAHLSFAEILQQAGAIPLPPYIKRVPVDMDHTRYQTIYSKPRGSVAAPTAGLHFTDDLIYTLRRKQIAMEYLTLHVGAGTFKPVKTETIGGHDMHREWMDVKKETIQQLLYSLNKRKIIAIGTTSLRTLESLYWMGVDLLAGKGKNMSSGNVDQWRPYQNPGEDRSAGEALESLLAWMEAKKTDRIIGQTGLIIAPGYRFRIVNGLVTNFHQPQSTLLLLVAALVGDDWKKVYDHALENDFRFLSYGDGSLLLPKISSGEDQR